VPLALAAWLALRLTRGDWRVAPSWLLGAYGLYVVALAGSTIAAVDQLAALTETSRWLQAFGIFVMTLDLVRTRGQMAGVVAVLLLGGAFQAGTGLVQSFMGAGPASFAVAAGFSRAFGTFGMPNSYAGYLEMTLPLAVALCVWLLVRRPRFPTPGQRLIWLALPATAALLLAGILASFSRGAWLGTLVGVAAMVALASRRSLAIGAAAVAVAVALLGMGGAAVLPADWTGRLTSIGESIGYRDVRRMVITGENWAVAERLAMWEAGLAMFRAEPITGVGAGNYNVVYGLYRVPQFLYSRGHAHNYYIHAAAETGAIGLIAYGLVLVAAALDTGRGLRRVQEPWARAVTVGAVGVLAAVMTHNLVENLHVLNMNLHFFAVLSLPILACRLQRTERAT
jgi:O-antigen ligase